LTAATCPPGPFDQHIRLWGFAFLYDWNHACLQATTIEHPCGAASIRHAVCGLARAPSCDSWRPVHGICCIHAGLESNLASLFQVVSTLVTTGPGFGLCSDAACAHCAHTIVHVCVSVWWSWIPAQGHHPTGF
jgi:hypothetical protein